MDEETIITNESFFDKLRQLLNEDLGGVYLILKDKDIKDLNRLKNDLAHLVANLKREEEMESFMNLLACFLWKQEAMSIMDKPNNIKDEKLSQMLESAPKSIKSGNSKEFNQIAARLKGKGQVMVDERQVYDKVFNFLDTKTLQYEKINRFIEANRGVKENIKIEKYLDLLQNMVKIFNNEEFLKVDWLLEELIDTKLIDTESYIKLDQIKNDIENAKREKCNLQANRLRLQTNSFNHKLKDTKAAESLKYFEKLPKGVMADFIEEINKTKGELNEIEQLKVKVEDFKKKNLGNSAAKNLKEVQIDSVIAEYENMMKAYGDLMYNSEKTETLLENLRNTIKAYCLLEGKEFLYEGKSLAVWEKICDSFLAENPLKSIMMTKIVSVRAFLDKVDTIKNWTKGTEKPDINNLRSHLKEAQKFQEEIDFQVEQNWAETLIKGIQSRQRDIEEPAGSGSIMLHELQSHIEYFKRAPVNLESILSKYKEKEKQALEFLRKIRLLSPAAISQKFDPLNKEYLSLGVVILEYDDISYA